MDRIEQTEEDVVELGVASLETQGGPIDVPIEPFVRRLPPESISKD